ncbi:hypothetical protein ACH0B6_17440 [Solibacillus silvestris]
MNIKIKAIFLKLMIIVSIITVMLIAILISVFLKDKNKLGDYDEYFVSLDDKIQSDEAVKVTSSEPLRSYLTMEKHKSY